MIDLHGYGWQLMQGLGMTIRAALAAILIAILLGLLGAAAKLSRWRWLRGIAETYTITIRGVPELILLYIVFFGLTHLLQWVTSLFGYDEYIEVPPFAAGVFSVGFVYGAFATEVFRGAILAVPKGQIEAAKAVGMSPFLLWRRILMPQVIRYAIPGMGNVWLVLLKATALMSVVNLDELTRKAFIGAGATRDPLSFFLTAALLYLMLTIVSNLGLEWLERRYSRGVRRA
ncbi:MAG: transporter [Rhodospirillales bacterium]|jgi:His/Glu/Gln/Arg/opine family amino acid ABC transporter permease subunit|nr:transporter [Rhodospirillales bacterium]